MNSWDLSGWFPKCASRCAHGSMRKVLRKHDARGSSCGSSRRPYMRLEKLFAQASRKHLAEGSVEARCSEVPTRWKLVFAEAPRKLAGGRVVISKETNKE